MSGLSGLFGEDDYYKAFMSVSPLFDEDTDYDKKVRVFASVAKKRGEWENKEYISAHYNKGAIMVNKFYYAGKRTYPDYLPDAYLEGRGINISHLVSIIANKEQVNTSDITIKQVYYGIPETEYYAKYYAQEHWNYDIENNHASYNNKEYTYGSSSYNKDTNMIKVTLQALNPYSKVTYKTYYQTVELTNDSSNKTKPYKVTISKLNGITFYNCTYEGYGTFYTSDSEPIDDEIISENFSTYDEADEYMKQYTNNDMITEEVSSITVNDNTQNLTATFESPTNNQYLVSYKVLDNHGKALFIDAESTENDDLTSNPITRADENTPNIEPTYFKPFPIVLMRYEKKNLRDVAHQGDINQYLTVDRYEKSKKLLKAVGFDFDDIFSAIENQVRSQDEDTWSRCRTLLFFMGVHPKSYTKKEGNIDTTAIGVAAYMYNFFSYAHSIMPAYAKDAHSYFEPQPTNTDFTDWFNQTELYYTTLYYHIEENPYYKSRIQWNPEEDTMEESRIGGIGFCKHRLVTTKYRTEHESYFHITVRAEYTNKEAKTGCRITKNRIERIDYEVVSQYDSGKFVREISRNVTGGYKENIFDVAWNNISGKNEKFTEMIDNLYRRPEYAVVFEYRLSIEYDGDGNEIGELYTIPSILVEHRIVMYGDYGDDRKVAYLENNGWNYNSLNRVEYNNYDLYVTIKTPFNVWVETIDEGNDNVPYRRILVSNHADSDNTYWCVNKVIYKLYLWKQIDATHVHKITISNLEVVTTLWNPEGDELVAHRGNRNDFALPLVWYPYKKCGLLQKTNVFAKGFFIEAQYIYHEHSLWYETKAFNRFIGPFIQVAMIIITVVVTIFTPYLAPGVAKAGLTVSQIVFMTIGATAAAVAMTFLAQAPNSVFKVMGMVVLSAFLAYIGAGGGFGWQTAIGNLTKDTFLLVINVVDLGIKIVDAILNSRTQTQADQMLEEYTDTMKQYEDLSKEYLDIQKQLMYDSTLTSGDVVILNQVEASGEPVVMSLPELLQYGLIGQISTELTIEGIHTSVGEYVDNSVALPFSYN